MGWLGDGSHRGQGCQAWTAVGLPPRAPVCWRRVSDKWLGLWWEWLSHLVWSLLMTDCSESKTRRDDDCESFYVTQLNTRRNWQVEQLWSKQFVYDSKFKYANLSQISHYLWLRFISICRLPCCKANMHSCTDRPTRRTSRGGSKGWPGGAQPPPCDSCAPTPLCSPLMKLVARLYNTCIYSVVSNSWCQITPFTLSCIMSSRILAPPPNTDLTTPLATPNCCR